MYSNLYPQPRQSLFVCVFVCVCVGGGSRCLSVCPSVCYVLVSAPGLFTRHYLLTLRVLSIFNKVKLLFDCEFVDSSGMHYEHTSLVF